MISAVIFLRSQSPVTLYLWCGIGFFGGLWLFVSGFRMLQRRRLILDTPFSKIRSASMGMVEVSGLAVGPYTLVAPISARPCYYYRTEVSEWKREGKNSKWVKVARECMHLPFFVDDNTGRMLVNPRGAELDLHRNFGGEFCNSFFTTKDPAPANVNSFLSRHGIVTDNKIKVEEFCIKPKNSLFILGTVAENRGLEVNAQPVQDHEALSPTHAITFSLGPLLSYGTASETDVAVSALPQSLPLQRVGQEVVRLSPASDPAKGPDMTQQQRVTAALLKAGITNPAAWAAGGVLPVSAPVVQDSSVGSDKRPVSDENAVNGFDIHPPVVLGKGQNDKAFLISWRSQREVARSLGWKSALMILGGPSLALVSLYVFLNLAHLL